MDISNVLGFLQNRLKIKRKALSEAKTSIYRNFLNSEIREIIATMDFISQERQDANDMIHELQTEIKVMHKTADALLEIARIHGIPDDDTFGMLFRGLESLTGERIWQDTKGMHTVPKLLQPFVPQLNDKDERPLVNNEVGFPSIKLTLAHWKKLDRIEASQKERMAG